MLADSFHAQVEKGLKKKIKLQDYQDLVDIVNEKGEAMELKFNNFFDIKKEVSQGKYASNKPKLENVQVVLFIRGLTELHWKQSYDDSAVFLQKKAIKKIHVFFETVEKPRGVNTAKKDNLIKTLIGHLDENRRRFWLNLPTNDESKDLFSERDPAEEEEVQ